MKSRRKTISGSLFSLEDHPSAAIQGDVRLLFPTGFSSSKPEVEIILTWAILLFFADFSEELVIDVNRSKGSLS